LIASNSLTSSSQDAVVPKPSTSLICDAATGRIGGYVTLSAGQIERAALPKAPQRNKPDPVPATPLGQLAIDRDHQGEGYARSLLHFALRTALRASYDIGSFGVFTHPLDDTARTFYARWGLVDLPFDPRRAMIVRMVDLERNGLGQ
jgi:GNAT superfamily N-acetyltransferase